MIFREYLGIYINEFGVQTANCYKLLPGLLPGNKGLFKQSPATHASLTTLLDSIKPSKKRRIYIALPRHAFFSRCIKFPELPLDDVRDAMINRLEDYSHLPLEEIYYDVLFSKAKEKGVNALLYYAPRKKLDFYINQVRESGHIRSLEAVYPVSYGAGPYFWGHGNGSKNALIIQYQDATELAVYHGNTCIDTFYMDTTAGKDAWDTMVRDILADHDMVPEQVRHVKDRIPEAGNKKHENMGDISIAPLFDRIQPVSVDGNLPRIKLFKPYTVLIPLFILLAIVLICLSMEIGENLSVRQAELDRVNAAIKKIDKEIDPILKSKDALEKATAYKEDVEAFMAARPPLFSYINDIADHIPSDTWFPSLAYKPGMISMQCRGDDVLKVVESLRASGKYKDVKLIGSISRAKDGKHKFMLDLVLREPVDVIKGRQNR